MIQKEDFKDRNVEIIGETDERIEMGVDTENINHLMMILSSNLYQNSIASIIREYTSNAIDANVEAGHDEPVIVRIKQEGKNNFSFEVEDYGPGLDDKDFRNTISKYGKSTKRDKENQLGFYGLGTKSAFSYTDTFYYTCRKDGIERKYLLYKGANGFTIDLLFEDKTDKRNGVTVNIPIKNNDSGKFLTEIKNQLCYFDNVYFDITIAGYYGSVQHIDLNSNFKIYQEKDFQYSSLKDSNYEMHITLGRVNYPIDWNIIGIPRLQIPVALKFDLNSGLFPIPNREHLIWNDETKLAVREKINKVSEWFINDYNSKVQSKTSLYQAWNYIGITSKEVSMFDRKFYINELEPYSTIKFKEPEVPGIKLISPVTYKAKLKDLLRNYRVVARISSGKLKSTGIYDGKEQIISHPGKVLLLGENDKISGFFREYLKTTPYTIFTKPELIDLDNPHIEDLEYFKQLLNLRIKKKTSWRAMITEYQTVRKGFVEECMADGTKLIDSQEVADFKKAHKATQIRVSVPGKKLNKQQGDVTISYNEKKKYTGQFFKKDVYKLESLHSNKFLTIIMTDEQGEDLDDYYKIFQKQNVKFAKIGIQDLKKITQLKLHNFMELKDLDQTKPFKRAVTAMLADKILQQYDTTYNSNIEIIQESVGKFKSLYNRVRDYKNNNLYNGSITGKLSASLLATAEQNNIWDEEFIGDVRKLQGDIDKYDFVSLFQEPDEMTPEMVKKYTSLINTILLFKKLNYDEKYSNLEICVKSSVPSEAIEEADEVDAF